VVTSALDRQLAEIEACRYRFGRNDVTRIVKLLNRLEGVRFTDPEALIRFHENLLFLRAFPQRPSVVRATERILRGFHRKVEALHKGRVDMADFDTFEVSGIAGTEMEDTLSFDVARWLVKRLPGKVEIAWEDYEPGRELSSIGSRFLPLLEDDADVEADTPWRQWLATAGGKKNTTAAWLISRFEQFSPPQLRAELYEALRVPLRWKLENSIITRTRNWKRVRTVFYHRESLISRSQVSLAAELARRPPRLTKLSRKQGSDVMEMAREVMLARYRELYGTTLGDPASVVRADLGGHEAGRGVEIYLWNLPPEHRLPLRAYVAGLTLKNGVPANYIEAIGLCEWMEVGFNTFYTFRGGEVGWIYAQVLRCLCHLTGTTCISVYPYQLGKDNEEAIESGAFWFYRKLGFRPRCGDLQRLAEREEQRIAADPKYRTPARKLRRLAAEHVFYELPGSEIGRWDGFSTRSIGLRVNRRMARDFGGDAGRMRQHSRHVLERNLFPTGNDTSAWAAAEKTAFDNFALVLTQVPGLATWTRKEKEDLLRIIRAKGDADEMVYLHLTQRHERLRRALLAVGP
jgi:hypothetical protein